MKSLLMASLILVISAHASGDFGGGGGGVKIDAHTIQNIREVHSFQSKVDIITDLYLPSVNAGVGGAAGGGVKPEQRQVFELIQRAREAGLVKPELVNNLDNDIELDKKPLYLNIQDISEFTLKDGTVIRAEEILENLKK